MPFCTGSVPEAVNDALFTAFGCLPPPLMHAAVPESTATICASPPRPASFALTVMVLPEVVTVGVPTKCGLPANAAVAEPRPTAPSIPTAATMTSSLLLMLFLPCESLPTRWARSHGRTGEEHCDDSLPDRNVLMARLLSPSLRGRWAPSFGAASAWPARRSHARTFDANTARPCRPGTIC